MIKQYIILITFAFFHTICHGKDNNWNKDLFLSLISSNSVAFDTSNNSTIEEIRKRPKKARRKVRKTRKRRSLKSRGVKKRRIYSGKRTKKKTVYSSRPRVTHGSIDYYTNTYGRTVQSPTYYSSRPPGATARCRDGTYSFSQSRRGTCSGHGGVAEWYY